MMAWWCTTGAVVATVAALASAIFRVAILSNINACVLSVVI